MTTSARYALAGGPGSRCLFSVGGSANPDAWRDARSRAFLKCTASVRESSLAPSSEPVCLGLVGEKETG